MNVLIFGATGMIGGGALRECLEDPLRNRTPAGGFQVTTTEQFGRKMIDLVRHGSEVIFEARDLNRLSATLAR